MSNIYADRADFYSDEQVQIMLSEYESLENTGKLCPGLLRAEVEDLIEKTGMPPHEPTFVAKDLLFEGLRRVAMRRFESMGADDNG